MTSIVIITRDRYRLIAQTIDSLYANTPNDQFNLTVVDDSSSDFRCSRLLRLINRPNYSLLEVSNSGHTLSQLKNIGVAWSEQRWGRGDWLCITDNDVHFMEGWLERMIGVSSHSPAKFSLFGGQHHPFHSPTQTIGIGTVVTVTEHDCLAGTHWFMPWSTWDTYGPFDRTTAPGVCQSEDYAFTQRIRADGGRIGVTSPACVIDCGITQTDGKLSPGAELKVRVAGVYYE